MTDKELIAFKMHIEAYHQGEVWHFIKLLSTIQVLLITSQETKYSLQHVLRVLVVIEALKQELISACEKKDFIYGKWTRLRPQF